MSFEQGAGFRICGVVVRRYINDQSTFANVTVEVPGKNGRMNKIDVRCFADGPIDVFRDLGQGMTVQITGGIDNEKLTDKTKQAVKVNGFDKWVTALTAKDVKVEAASKAPAKEPEGW